MILLAQKLLLPVVVGGNASEERAKEMGTTGYCRALLAVATLGARRAGDATDVTLRFELAPTVTWPEYLVVTWGAGLGVDIRVPASGFLPASGELGSLFVQMDGSRTDARRVIVKGLREGRPVAIGAKRVPWRARSGNETVTLATRLSDGDGDGIPDDVDDDCGGAARVAVPVDPWCARGCRDGCCTRRFPSVRGFRAPRRAGS